MNEEQVLCASSSYEEKYYLNPRYASLPTSIQEELQIMCVKLTLEVGGTFTITFEEDGSLYLLTSATEGDLLYDEIGAHLKVKQMRKEHQELLEGLEFYYQSFFLNKNI